MKELSGTRFRCMRMCKVRRAGRKSVHRYKYSRLSRCQRAADETSEQTRNAPSGSCGSHPLGCLLGIKGRLHPRIALELGDDAEEHLADALLQAFLPRFRD